MPLLWGQKGDGSIQFTVAIVTALAVSGSVPQQGIVSSNLFQQLMMLEAAERQHELLLLDTFYENMNWASGAFEEISGVQYLIPGTLAEIRVWRPLSPADLALLDRSGFWPVSFSPSYDTFAALVTSEITTSDIPGSGFIRSIRPWNAVEYSSPSQPQDWSGHFLLIIPGDEIPAGCERLSGNMVRIAGSASDFNDYCRLDGVVQVIWEQVAYPQNEQFRADDSRRLISCPSIWEYYHGEYVNTGVLDTGVWAAHPDLSSAVISGPVDPDGHGTAVCGVISSRGDTPLGCEYNGRGVADEGSLVVLQRPVDMTPSQLDGFFSDFSQAECKIVNNSWGFPSTGYDVFCNVVDTWVDQEDLVLVFSAGNAGGEGTITSPGNAKNCITVGAVTYIPDENGNCYLAPYSSRGPTTGDGRLKPEILAPGGAFTGSTMESGIVTTNAQYGGQWLDDPENRWPGEPSYTRMTGTSMAAAHVSGALMICYEKYGELINPEDISALLVASSIPLSGNTGSPLSGYASTGYGYGLIDAFHLPGVYFSEEVDRPLWVHETYNEGTPYREWIFYIPATIERLSGVLAYSDVPGEGIMNDLDFTLIAPGGTVYNYTLPAGVTGESPIEKICVETPESGAWRARITARRWSDPGNPFEEEDYSVVVYSYSKSPGVGISSPADTTIYAAPGSVLNIPLAVRNSGGYIVAGTWSSIEAPSGFSGDVFEPRYMGNLVYEDAVGIDTFTVETPSIPGTYDLLARVNGANLGLQPDSSAFQVIIAYPDLTVTMPSPEVSPPFYVGQSVRFSVVVTNAGEGPSESCQLGLYLEEEPDSTTNPVAVFQIPAMQGGDSQPFSSIVTFTYFDMGQRYLAAVVDTENSVMESSENNNRAVYGPFSVDGLLAPPENLSAQSGNDGFVPLSWNSPDPDTTAASSKGLAGYNLYRSLTPLGPSPDPIISLTSTDTTYTDTLVSNGVTYYYWATTIYSNPHGESDLSNMASATPQGPSGSLAGEIWDVHTGHRLGDISVQIVDLSLEAITNSEGLYIFENVPVGPVPVTVQQTGYYTVQDTVIIIENDTTAFDIPLERILPQSLNVIPNPFTPNDDGINDAAFFIWPGVDGELISVTIYTIDGIPIRSLEGREPFWDGKDDSAVSVAGGLYVYMAWAGDNRSSGVICLAR